jgi:hypothetical protein
MFLEVHLNLNDVGLATNCNLMELGSIPRFFFTTKRVEDIVVIKDKPICIAKYANLENARNGRFLKLLYIGVAGFCWIKCVSMISQPF